MDFTDIDATIWKAYNGRRSIFIFSISFMVGVGASGGLYFIAEKGEISMDTQQI